MWNRGPLKILNAIKLILDSQGNHLDSYTISLESFRFFRGPLFHKPVTGHELFLLFLTANRLYQKTVILLPNLSNFTLNRLLLEVDPTLEFHLEFLKNSTDAVCLCYIIPTENLKNIIDKCSKTKFRTHFLWYSSFVNFSGQKFVRDAEARGIHKEIQSHLVLFKNSDKN